MGIVLCGHQSCSMLMVLFEAVMGIFGFGCFNRQLSCIARGENAIFKDEVVSQLTETGEQMYVVNMPQVH